MTVTTHHGNCAPTVASNEGFRKWIQFVHDAFANCGLVQTSDTGQIDIASAEPGSVANTPAGYEIWRFDDALQSAHPLFIKVEYGRGGHASSNVPAVWFTVGRATDGAGTLSGILFPRSQWASAATVIGTATEYPCYASGCGSAFALVMWPSAQPLPGTATGWLFFIERQRSSTGEPQGDAVAIGFARHAAGGSGANNLIRVIGYDGSDTSRCAESDRFLVSFPRRINGVAWDVGATLSADGVTAPVLPVPFLAPGVTPWVSNAVTAVYPGDAGSTSVIQVAEINGEERTYRAFPYLANNTDLRGGGGLAIHEGSDNLVRWAYPAIQWATD